MDAAERMLRWWDEHSDPRVEIGGELRPLGPCKCGEVQIPSHFRRVLAGDVAHRRTACGPFQEEAETERFQLWFA